MVQPSISFGRKLKVLAKIYFNFKNEFVFFNLLFVVIPTQNDTGAQTEERKFLTFRSPNAITVSVYGAHNADGHTSRCFFVPLFMRTK